MLCKKLKSEQVWHTAFQTRAQFIDALAHYIDGFYNPCRQLAIGFTNPNLFEGDPPARPLFTKIEQVHYSNGSNLGTIK